MADLTRRYVVMVMAAEAPFDLTDHDAPFVLKPWKDPAALRALMVYRDHCYPELGRDLDEWIRVISAGPVVRGDVGRRNEAHARDASARLARAPAGGRARRASARVVRERGAAARGGGKRARAARPRTGRAKKRR